ncbi:unnamed protein product [Taenia asiatica]|uniref:Muscleblind-like CCCH zinc finger domain-containing protein n=1 Tax=Taenia asiatica TaxID=60517 RepID=A0A3P6R9U8_TAEAS|nr:unnamed protein product [Taenia asiatica]
MIGACEPVTLIVAVIALLQGKCQRRDPPCKYFHPPQHLRELLLQNGRNNLILKNMQLQLLQQQLAQGAMLPGLSAALAATASTPSVASPGTAGTHGIAGAPQCPNPTSPVSSASIGPTVSDLVGLPPWKAYLPARAFIESNSPRHGNNLLIVATVPTPAIAAAAAALAAANLDASSTQQLAQIFPSPKTVLVSPLCTSLYSQAQTTSPTMSRKRPAACVNDPASAVYAPLFSAPSVLAYGPQLDSTAYHLGAQPISAANPLGVGLSPYLTPTQLNSMAAAAATAAAMKSVPPTVSLANGGGAGAGGLSAAHLAAMAAAATAAAAANASAVAPLAAPATPAKRPALADAKSGLPMFDYGQGLYALQTQAQAQLVGAKNFQPPPPPSQSQSPQQAPQKSSTSTSVATTGVNVGGVVAQENGVSGQENGAPSDVETQKAQVAAVGQFYPETCESIPCSRFKVAISG